MEGRLPCRAGVGRGGVIYSHCVSQKKQRVQAKGREGGAWELRANERSFRASSDHIPRFYRQRWEAWMLNCGH